MLSSLYAFLLTTLFLTLTIRTILIRRSLKIALGDGGDARLNRAIRAHANFCETVPFALLLFFLSEVNSVTHLILHICGGALLLGRILHACAVSSVNEKIKLRIAGMLLTLTSITALALLNLLCYVVSAFGLK